MGRESSTSESRTTKVRVMYLIVVDMSKQGLIKTDVQLEIFGAEIAWSSMHARKAGEARLLKTIFVRAPPVSAVVHAVGLAS